MEKNCNFAKSYVRIMQNRILMNRFFCLLCLCGTLLCGCKFFQKNSAFLPGEDRDAQGCVGSAGEQWSELLQRCIRVFEEGAFLQNADSSATTAAYLVLDEEGTQAELFIPTQKQGLRYHAHQHGEQILWHANGRQQEVLYFDGLYWSVKLQDRLCFFQEPEREEIIYAFENDDDQHYFVPVLFNPQAYHVTLTWEDQDYILPLRQTEIGYLYANADFALRCLPTGTYLKFVKKGQEYPLHTH